MKISKEKKQGKHKDKDKCARYLTPYELPQSEENTPHPFFQVQRLTTEWLSSKLYNHNLHKTINKRKKEKQTYMERRK